MEIKLSAEELLDLLLEKSIEREDLKVSSNSSFLLIMSLLDMKMTKGSDYAKFKLW